MSAVVAWQTGPVAHRLDGTVRDGAATLFHLAEDTCGASGGSQTAITFPVALLPSLRRLVEQLEQGGEQLELFGRAA